ncbi:protein SanA [Candidatus Gracilibacteria bacterium]|nr:MAG: protein SanA [Candidatus Gracilibacteria bacterium]
MKRLFILCIIFLLCIATPWFIITFLSKDRIYTQIETIPSKTYGLVLGTSPLTKGKTNRFFTTRIEAAKELYERGKIKKIIVSGSKNNDGYDEPSYMKNALIKAGIPAENIILDSQGFRTIDSIMRAKNTFKIPSATVISQPFHIERALFLAHMEGFDAIGYGAADIPLSQGIGTYIREIGARWKAMYDVLDIF